MKPLEFAGWIAVLLVLFGASFAIGKFLLPNNVVTEKLVPTEKLVLVNQTCPVCQVCSQVNLTTERIIEKTVPCPECKCYCKAVGAYGQANGTGWWYK